MNDKIDQKANFAKLPSGITVNFNLQILKSKHLVCLSFWDISRDSRAKIYLSMEKMWTYVRHRISITCVLKYWWFLFIPFDKYFCHDHLNFRSWLQTKIQILVVCYKQLISILLVKKLPMWFPIQWRWKMHHSSHHFDLSWLELHDHL